MTFLKLAGLAVFVVGMIEVVVRLIWWGIDVGGLFMDDKEEEVE